MSAAARTVTASSPSSSRSARRAAAQATKGIATALAMLALVAIPLPYLLRFDHDHIATAVVIALVICAMSLYSRAGAVVAGLVFLAVLGDYRRYVGYFEGYPQNDALLMVGPAIACFLFGQALLDRRVRLATGLAKLVAALMLVMLVEIFNPLQGGLQVGFAGALFYLVPLLWFWVGRAYASVELMEYLSFRVLVAIGVVAAIWGLLQAHFGLFAFEQLWVDRIGYEALYISDEVVRAIGFFNSSAEYQRCLIVAAVTMLAAWFAGRSKIVLLVPLLLAAVFFSAARGPIVMLAGATAVVWAVSARSRASWAPRFVLAAAAAAVVLVGTLTFLQSVSFGARFAPLVTRQLDGLLDPGNAKKSTALGHLKMIGDGIVIGVESPAGRGLGATTIAASKYGAQTVSAEVDFANITASLGVLGGLLYLTIIVVVLLKSLRWWRLERYPVALVTVGILTVTFGGWLIGGEYSMAALLWLYIGALDKLAPRRGRPLVRSADAARPRHA